MNGSRWGIITEVIAVLGAAVVMYPELIQLAKGKPIGNGISDIIVGSLILVLLIGLRVLNRMATDREHLIRRDYVADFILFGAISIINLLVFWLIPESPEALGLFAVTAVAAVLVLRKAIVRTSPSS